MTRIEKYNQVVEQKIIPVVVLEDAGKAEPLAEALLKGGLKSAEVTFRTEAAPEAIKRMSVYDELVVGAGTVLNVAQAEKALECGAEFVVMPGFSASVVEYCQKREVPVTPGVATPTEIMTALDMGLDLLKFFPAGNLGGPKTLKAIGGPFKKVRFIPTGGINADNMADYLSLPMVAAIGGSWMVKAQLSNENRWDEIISLTKQALEVAARF